MKKMISELTLSPRNEEIYTMSDIQDLKESMSDEKIGQLVPIVITKEGVIISGHRRYTAAKELGWEEIDVIEKVVKEEDVTKLLIHYNKQRNKSTKECYNEIKALREIYTKEQGRRNDLNMVDIDGTTTREVISKATGIKESRISRIEKIGAVAPGLLETIDAGKLSVEAAYKKCVRAEKGNIVPKADVVPKEKKRPETITCPSCDHTWALKI
jgi:ParB-like chromosome segregation protein Spo0J